MKAKPLYKIPIGTELTLDGHTWRVVAKDLNGYIVEGDDCDQTLLTTERVENAIEGGSCEVVTPGEKENRRRLVDFTGGYVSLDQLPEPGKNRAAQAPVEIHATEEKAKKTDAKYPKIKEQKF